MLLLLVTGCCWLEGLTKGLAMISPRFQSQNWRGVPYKANIRGQDSSKPSNYDSNFNV